MNDRQRILMQKIVEYGDNKWDVGFSQGIRSLPATDLAMARAAKTMNQLDNMVTEWVTMKQEGPSDESSSDLRVVVSQNVTEPYSNKDVTTLRKKDDLDREVGL